MQDQEIERTGPQRIRRDSTLAVMRTKIYVMIALAGTFSTIGIVCLLKTLLEDTPEDQMMLYLAALTCLLAATICGAGGASFAGALSVAVIAAKQVPVTEQLAHDIRALGRRIEDLDDRFKMAETRMIDRTRANKEEFAKRLTRLETREGLVLEGVSTLQKKLNDDLGKRRQVARQADPNTSMS